MDSKEDFGTAYSLYSLPRTPQTPVSSQGKLDWPMSNEYQRAEAAPVEPSGMGSLWQRCRPISSLIWSFVIFVVFSILHCLFILFVLIKGEVIIGSTTFDASTTNLLVSISSQASAILADTTLRQLLAALRLLFATSPGGTSAFTWFGIGLSSQWFTTAKFAVASYLLNAWCLLRLALPFLNLGFGSILKFQADFDYYFVPGQYQLPVYAGLVPVDTKLLDIVPSPDLCQYFATWSSSLQGNSRYATGTSIDGCGDGCKALIWPGGLETVRQVQPYLNISIFNDESFEDFEAIRIANAQGMLTTYRALDKDFKFNNTEDCVFGGKLNDDGFKMCVKQVGDEIAAGWISCSQKVKDAHACDTDEGWKFAPMRSQLLMGAYRQFTTTTYSRQNLSILNVDPESEPTRLPLIAADYLDIIHSLLVPEPSKASKDKDSQELAEISVRSLTYALNWVHRVYGEMFTGEENTLITVLENFLTIPLQFAVTAQQLANYTAVNTPLLRALGDFSMPDEMITTATGGSSTQKLVIKDWTGWTFIAADAVVLLIVFFGIVCIVQHRPLPTLTGLTELDILIESERMTCLEKGGEVRLNKLPIVSGAEESSNYTKSLRQWRMQYKT